MSGRLIIVTLGGHVEDVQGKSQQADDEVLRQKKNDVIEEINVLPIG